MNFTEENQDIIINNLYEDLLTNEKVSGSRVLKPYEVLVLRKSK